MANPFHSPRRVVQDLYALAIGRTLKVRLSLFCIPIVLSYSSSDISDSIVANKFQTCVPMIVRADSINKTSSRDAVSSCASDI